MHLETITARQAVDKAFLQEPITKTDFETFRRRLLGMLDHADAAVEAGESEEHMKSLIRPFLRGAGFGEEYFINTKERQDLAIHNGRSRKSEAGVIIEAKRPSNTAEMITSGDLNRKAFHETILYYLRERIERGNEDLRHIIITDVYRWYVFDAQDFERHFYKSKNLRQWYEEWNQGQKVSSRTQFVYDHLAEVVEGLDGTIRAAEIDLTRYRRLLEKEELSRKEQQRLVPLYKLFTPVHLLKQPFVGDSNSLNKAFYRELLYIMGLQEYKEKGTHYITRLEEDERQHASIIENTIRQLKSLTVLSRLPDRTEYGETEEEQLFNVAIELLIIWINRILFLKLLEAQLYRYHNEEERFRFLSHRQITEYDHLNKLFFQVLAVPEEERPERIRAEFGHIPYLNSSLFDVTDIEAQSVVIAALEDGETMPVHPRSKIRDRSGSRLKGEELSTLEYLMRFLDAYNFSTEGTAEVQEEAKTLINASVLGRIFEKINGYKDGSFFTPGYITEYMCRETIRRAVVQKFNGAFDGWECGNLDDVAGRIARHEVPYEEANAVVNSITVCDPAVGSGHFLVSALNELIAVKSELRIFTDEESRRIRDVQISVENDELSIATGEDPFFEYRLSHRWEENGRITRTVGADTQRLQRALFREKNTLIENCLFGVDINPNSVKICRLRLWIELLKHAYYREDADYQSLEVLPNIDINIKQGNSLVSRFGLDADLRQILSGSEELSIGEYKQAVRAYKESGDRSRKQALKEQIGTIKENFSVGLKALHPVRQELKKQREVLIREETKLDLFEGDKRSKKEQKKIEKAQKKITTLEAELEELESARFYDQAFEWRFEFPEVLDEEGVFMGFDVVIGNPPYIRQEQLGEFKPYFKEHYQAYKGTADIYVYFYEQGHRLLGTDGWFSMITSNKFMRTNYGEPLRNYLSDEVTIDRIIDFGELPVFDEAATFPCIFITQNRRADEQEFEFFQVKELKPIEFPIMIEEGIKVLDNRSIEGSNWSLADPIELDIIDKMRAKGVELEAYVDNEILRGIITGYNKAFIIDEDKKQQLINEDPKSVEVIKPVLKGNDIRFYEILFKDSYLILTEVGIEIEKYPAIKKHLDQHKERLEKRYDQGDYYWELRACGYYEEFEKPKIIYPDIAKESRFTLDTEGYYLTNTAYFIPSSDKYVLGILNSKLVFNYYKRVSSVLGDADKGGRMRWFRQDVSKIPIAEPTKEQKTQIESLVDQMLTARREDPDANTSVLEAEIDRLVYELYGLSEEEVGIVEGSVG